MGWNFLRHVPRESPTLQKGRPHGLLPLRLRDTSGAKRANQKGQRELRVELWAYPSILQEKGKVDFTANGPFTPVKQTNPFLHSISRAAFQSPSRKTVTHIPCP